MFARCAKLLRAPSMGANRYISQVAARRPVIQAMSGMAKGTAALAPLRINRLLAQVAFASKSSEDYEQASETYLEPSPSFTEDVTPSRQLFSSLKSSVSQPTLKALTVKPFTLTHMSEVQERVLGLMPGLIGAQGQDSDAEYSDAAEGEGGMMGSGRKDLLVKAKTGTGKTLGFLIPAVESRLRQVERLRKGGESAHSVARSTVGTLIISPTRELATQIANEARKLLTHHKDMEVQTLVGGESRRAQLMSFRKGRKDVVVGTPGRLRDLLENDPGLFADPFMGAEMLVLDEADTLLDMGFDRDLQFIIGHLPPSTARQTFLFSATVSPAIRNIARRSLARDHLLIDCVPENESNTHAHIPQYATVLRSAKDQLPTVLKMLAHDQLTNPGKSKTIIFLPTTKMTQLFATFMREMRDSLPQGKRTTIHEIHSKLETGRRGRASDAFRNDRGGASVLVTSDVSARGVDYPGVTRVIQVGISGSGEQYIHRVGRTGRGGSSGRGELILLPWEAGFIRNALRDVPIQETNLNSLTEELQTLGAEWDDGPEKFAEARGASLAPPAPAYGNRRFGAPTARKVVHEPFLPRIATIDAEVRELLTSLDEDAIYEVFIGNLGFYMQHSNDIGVEQRSIVQGMKTWAVEACGLEEEPYVSSALLAKMGMKDRPSRSGGGGGGSWGGRGKSFGRDAPSSRSSGGFGKVGGGYEGRQRSPYRDAR